MKRSLKVFILIFAVFLSVVTLGFLTVAIGSSLGIDIRGSTTTVTKDQNRSLFLSNAAVDVRRDVYGDLFVLGGTVDVRGDVYENLIVAGGIVRVTGNVRQSIVVIGGRVEINGRVWQDVLASGGYVKLNGEVGDDVRISGRTVEILESRIGGDLLVSGDKVSIDGETKVYGQKGIVQKSQKLTLVQRLKRDLLKWFVGTVISIIGWLIVSVVILRVAPVKVKNVLDCFSSWRDVALSFIAGLFVYPIVAFALLLLFISRIGIPVAILMTILGLLLTFVGWIFPFWGLLYKFSPSKMKSYLLSGLISVFIVALIFRIPIIGIIIRAMLTIFGVGAMILAKIKVILAKKSFLDGTKTKIE